MRPKDPIVVFSPTMAHDAGLRRIFEGVAVIAEEGPVSVECSRANIFSLYDF